MARRDWLWWQQTRARHNMHFNSLFLEPETDDEHDDNEIVSFFSYK